MSNHGDGVTLANMIREFASRTHIPVALHLDHGKAERALAFAFRQGFSSIMIDGSEYELEENIRRTKQIVDLAHREGVSVEGELGHVGAADKNDHTKYNMYTDPQQAKQFVDATGVDALAVAFGTAHGHYPKGLTQTLDFERLSAIKETVGIPLVMHGGSNSGDDNIRKAVQCGVNKINVCTDTFAACRDTIGNAVKENPDVDYLKLMQMMEKAAKDTIAKYIELAGSTNRAGNFTQFYDPYRTLWLGESKPADKLI
jgi:fructose-bisphosphate aldolase, class II